MQHLTLITCNKIIFKFLKESISEDHPLRFIDAFVKKTISVIEKMGNCTEKGRRSTSISSEPSKGMGLQSHEFNGFREGKW